MTKVATKKNVLNIKVKLAYIASLICLAYLIWATFNNLHQTNHESQKVKTSLSRLLQLENILVNIKSIESGQRGFILSGDDKYLGSYYRGITGIRKDTTVLKEFSPNEKNEKALQQKLLKDIHAKIAHSENTINIFKKYGIDSIQYFIDSKAGIKLMDSINTYVYNLENNDRAVLHAANANAQRLAKETTVQLTLLAIFFLFILCTTYYITNRDIKKILSSEKQLKFNASLIRNISDPIITTTNNDLISNWNVYAQQLYGYEEAEVVGKNIYDVLKISEENDQLESFALDKGGDYWKGESVHYHKNGEQLFVEVTVSGIKDETGDNQGFVSVVRDITKRKLAEDQLNLLKTNLEEEVKIKSAELTNVFSRITDAFIALDNNWNYTYLNKQAAELHGRSIEDLLGKNVWQEYPQVMNEPFYEALLHAKKTREPQRLQLYYSEIGKWYEDLIYPSDDGISVYYHDITTRRKAEMALQLAHAKLNYHINNTPMGVVEFDIDNKIVTWSYRAAEIFGWTDDEMLKQENALQALVHEEDIPQMQQSIAGLAYRETNKGIMHIRNYTKQGKIIYCDWYNSILKDNDGNVTGIMSLVQDVTDKYLATKELEESRMALQKSNERFELVAKATDDSIWDWNLQKQVIWGNEAFQKLFGSTAETHFTIEGFLERVHPDDRERIDYLLKDSFAKGKTFIKAEFRFLVKENISYIIVDDKAHILYNKEGEPIRLLGALQDITKQKLNEQRIIFEKDLSDTIINSLPGVFYLYNSKGQFYRWNKNLELVTEYSSEEIKRLTPLDLINPIDVELVAQKIGNVFATGQDYVESSFISKTGKIIHFYFTGQVIQYEGETCLMGVGIDITDRLESQRKLMQSEERYRTLIEQASDGIFISNADGKYLDVNSNGMKMSGYSREELIELTIYDLMAEGDHLDNPIRLDELLKGNVVINERKLKRKDGLLIHVEISAKLLVDGRFLGMVRDITARKKAEEELKLSEEKYRLLFYQNPMPMMMISMPERNFLDVNDAALNFYGYSKEEFLSMNVMDIRPPEDKGKLQDMLHGRGPGINYAGIWRHVKKDGSIVRIDVTSHDISYEGQPARLVLADDVTEQITAEENLQKSHEAYKQLASHLETIREAERTHMAREIHDELGQQLTGLKMDISWLSRRIKSDDKEVQVKIGETIALIDGTVRTVRRIATELRPSILDDLGLVAAMEWQSEEFERRSSIKTKFESNVAAIAVDTDMATGVFRIYQESLTNVMRHADADAVETALIITDTEIKLTISDNGKGFVVEEIANKKTLGLMGMRERATLLGGTYEIISTPENGTSVIIVVPLEKK